MIRRRKRNHMILSSGFSNQRSQNFDHKIRLRENFRSEGQTIDSGSPGIYINYSMFNDFVDISSLKMNKQSDLNFHKNVSLDPNMNYPENVFISFIIV